MSIVHTGTSSAGHPDGGEFGIGRVGQHHPRFEAGAQVIQDIGRDPLTREDGGDPRRVGGDLLGRDTADCLIGRNVFRRAEECVPRQIRRIQVEITRIGSIRGGRDIDEKVL